MHGLRCEYMQYYIGETTKGCRANSRQNGRKDPPLQKMYEAPRPIHDEQPCHLGIPHTYRRMSPDLVPGGRHRPSRRCHPVWQGGTTVGQTLESLRTARSSTEMCSPQAVRYSIEKFKCIIPMFCTNLQKIFHPTCTFGEKSLDVQIIFHNFAVEKDEK